jgi:cytochrome c oxidase cbb3-type subunit IV
MNELFNVNFWRSATTVLGLLVFLGILIWAYTPKRMAEFDEAALLPFKDEMPPNNTKESS